MTRIAIVDDIPELREDVHDLLTAAGHEVAAAMDGRSLDDLLSRFPAEIVILDIGLPGENGLHIARRLRADHPELGIIMLTGRSALPDRLAGHREGADHYLCKPVEPEELLLVVNTLARRLPTDQRSGWALDTAGLRLIAPCGQATSLTASETCVLEVIARSPQRQGSRRQLVEALGFDWENYDERRLESIMSRLRRKLSAEMGREAPLRALRGQGYGFVEALRCP